MSVSWFGSVLYVVCVGIMQERDAFVSVCFIAAVVVILSVFWFVSLLQFCHLCALP